VLITAKCAWCGSTVSTTDGGLPDSLNVSHSICEPCAANLHAGLSEPHSRLRERRGGADRRKGERRRSTRYAADTIIILDRITWVDNVGTDRRRGVRRCDDRLMMAKRILEGTFRLAGY